ncbi:hypothetical protein FD723_40255 (plasmid) [Nostoc sp. C052]|uniref:hypothetical protein n=1 Tax=Nostoc sp. C052 TaxID=2576902 RepID=UPI0015C2D8F4|nr:hypothetical protein [Nostoc sp. C052]QLE46447.1 hypothetical protein FD723_40255 [Nostoc sp. C052]
MTKSDLAYNRTATSADKRRINAISKKWDKAETFDRATFQEIKRTNPCAAALHLSLQVILQAVTENSLSDIDVAKSMILREAAVLTQMSIKPDFRLSKEQIAVFYGFTETVYGTIAYWRSTGERDLIERFYRYRLHKFLADIIDAVSVAMAIASKRVIFLNQEFAITYGASELVDQGIVHGELFISVVNSSRLWSMHRDDKARIKFKTLRSAKRTLAQWRGANIVGEITHEDAQRIADYLGLIPVPDPNRKLVMLKGSSKQSKGFG